MTTKTEYTGGFVLINLAEANARIMQLCCKIQKEFEDNEDRGDAFEYIHALDMAMHILNEECAQIDGEALEKVLGRKEEK